MADSAFQLGGLWIKLVDLGETFTPLLDEGATQVPLYALAVEEQSDAGCDGVESAHTVVPLMLSKVHDGDYWEMDNVMASVKDNDAINILIAVGNGDFHYTFSVSGIGSLEWSVYEGAVGSDGSPVTPRNLRRSSGDSTSPIAAKTNVTVEDYGTRLIGNFTGTNGQDIGSGIPIAIERVMKPNTTYLLEVINRAGKTGEMGILIQGYKE